MDEPPYNDANNLLLPVEINQNKVDGKADFMIKLLEKLPQVITKPIVVQHTQTVDERFTLTVNENSEDEQQQQKIKIF